MSNGLEIKNVDILELEEYIEQQDIVIVDFWAPWCAPCLAFADVYAKAAEDSPQICFLKMNLADANAEVMDSLGIQSIPHLMIFKQGKVVYSEAGTMPLSVLKDLIAQVLSLEL